MLTLVRHTRPDPAVARLCYGRTDVALAATFAAEADALVARLPPVACIVTSPATRCRRLAERLAVALGASVIVGPGWHEMDFGRWEGLAWDDVPRAELDAWAADFDRARPHGGESVADLLARTRSAIAAVPAASLVVTHAGPIRAALSAGGTPAWQRPIGFGEIVTL